jgi:hypothetical protein
MHMNDSYPYRQEVELALRQLNEAWAVAWNAAGIPTVYLYYHSRYYPLGSPASVARLSLGALGETIALAKRQSECGYEMLPTGTTTCMEIGTPGYGAYTSNTQAELEPPVWLQELQAPLPVRASRPTVPLACLCLPLSVLHQLLQLPPDYVLNYADVEDGTLHVYCRTPECTAMGATQLSGHPAIHVDYQVEERDGKQWRSLVSIAVESTGVQ